MKTKALLFIVILLTIQTLEAQPKKVWTKLFGGNGTELCFAASKLNDSLFSFVGNSNSANLGNKGLTDAIIGVVNKDGILRNLKTFGGPQQDQLNSVDVLPSGNLICGGQNNGAGGDVNANYGLIDGFIMSYNPITNAKLWSKTFGGGNNDQISDVKFLETGKIIFVGSSKSMSNDIPTNVGGSFDAFVSTIDEAGNIVRVKMFAGSKDDFAKKIAKINEGSFYVGGETVSSNEGAFLGLTNKGKKDVFVLKLNRNTNQLSLFMLGGPGDDLLVDMATTSDGGCVLVLNVNTSGGDIDSLIGGKDIFVVRYDATGMLLWKKMMGGTKDDEAVAAKLNEAGELLITATSNSIDRDIKGNYGDKDVMLFKIDDTGALVSSTNYGGSRGEAAGSLVVDKTNIYLISSAFSTNNDLPSTNPGGEFWVTNLFECSKAGTPYSKDLCDGDSTIIGGDKYHAGKTSGRFTIPGAGAFGCDSIVDVSINLLQKTFGFLTDTLCNDGTITVNNVIFDKNKTSHTFNLDNANGCDSTLNVLMIFSPAIVVTDSMLKSDNGTFNGYVHISVGGGLPPYKFEWSNGSRTINIDDIRFGTYTVTITDKMNCIKSYSFVVKSSVNVDNPEAASLQLSQTKTHLLLNSSEVITEVSIFSVNGSNPLISMNPNHKETRVPIDNLQSGLYIINLRTADKKKHIEKIIID